MIKKTQIAVLSVIVLGLLASVGSYFWFQATKPAIVNVLEYETVDKLNTNELLTLFTDNEDRANMVLVEKVIEVRGVISDISYMNDRLTLFLQSDQFSKSFVICDMSPLRKAEIDRLKTGDSIVVKGVCKGFLGDVIMLNCIPIEY